MATLRHRFGTIAALAALVLSVLSLLVITLEQWRRQHATDMEQGEATGSYAELLLDNWQLLIWPPLLFAAVAYFTTRWLVQRSLQPIETIRRELESITSSNLGRRVTVTETSDEVEHLGVTLNETLDRLESAVLANERLVADAAHELRTPLTAVRAALEVENTRRPQELLEESIVEVDRAGQLIDDLLLLARSPSTESRLELLDLDDVVGQEILRLRRQHPELDVEHDIHPVQQRLAKEAVGSVVRNLLENAAKYGDGRIKISLSEEGVYSYLVVEDNGQGIPADQRADVLQRFSRLDRSRDRSTGGSGLGLAIVTETVEAHRGVIDISDSSLGGCKMTISFPMDPAGVARPTAPTQTTGGDAIDRLAANAPKPNGRRRMVLAGVTLSLVGAGAVGAYLWQQSNGTEEQDPAGPATAAATTSTSATTSDTDSSTSSTTLDTTGERTEDVEGGAIGVQLSRSDWIVSASHFAEERGELPDQAIDGDRTTRWSTGLEQVDGMWFEVDLGSEQDVSRIELEIYGESEADYPRAYTIRVATDDGDLGPVIASNPSFGISDLPTVIELPQQSVRRIRITQTGTSQNFWWSISEIHAFGVER